MVQVLQELSLHLRIAERVSKRSLNWFAVIFDFIMFCGILIGNQILKIMQGSVEKTLRSLCLPYIELVNPERVLEESPHVRVGEQVVMIQELKILKHRILIVTLLHIGLQKLQFAHVVDEFILLKGFTVERFGLIHHLDRE